MTIRTSFASLFLMSAHGLARVAVWIDPASGGGGFPPPPPPPPPADGGHTHS